MVERESRFRFYKGRPVKRMRQVKDGIILTFVSPEARKPGEQITISQTDWDQHGEWRPAPARMADIRKLAAQQS